MSRLVAEPAPELVEEDARVRPLVPRLPAWRHFLPRPLRDLVTSMVLVLGVASVGLASSMALLGAPKAVTFAAGRKRPVGFHVGSFTKQATVGNQDIPLPAGTANLRDAPAGSWAIVFWGDTQAVTSGTWAAHSYGSLGYVANGGGTISQYAVGWGMADAQAASDTSRRMAAACFTVPNTAGSGTFVEGSFVSFPTATTMRINWGTNASGTPPINFAIITGLTNAKVVNWTTPTAVGSKTVTGVGFTPDLVLHAAAAVAAATSIAHAYFAFGAMNKHGQQWANSFKSSDAVSPSNTSRWQQTDAAYVLVDHNEATAHQAHFTSMDADGFTTYFSTTNGAAQDLISLCMEGVSSKIGAFTAPSSGTTQTVATRQGFTPKGALFSGMWAGAPQASPVAHAMWSLGATDFTNHRAAALTDQDNLATTDANSLWHSAYSLTVGGLAPSTLTAGAAPTATRDEMPIAWSAAPGATFESLYLLVGDDGVDTFPVTTATSTIVDSTSTAYSNQKKGVELSEGTLVRAITTDGGTHGYFAYSSDGQTWTLYASAGIAGWSNGSIDAYVDSGGTERLVAVWKQSGTGGGRTDGYLYAMVGTFNADRTTLTWGTAYSLTASTLGNYPDLVCHAEGDGGRVHVVASRHDTTSSDVVWYWRGAISSTGVLTEDAGLATLGGAYGAATPKFPSIALGAGKRLLAAWTAGLIGAGDGIRFRTASEAEWKAGTWAAEVEVDNTRKVDIDHEWVVCRWDGTRAVIAIAGDDGANADVVLYDSTDFVTFTPRVLYDNASLPNRFYGGSMQVDPATGDVWLFGTEGTAFEGVYMVKWTRATATLGTVTRLASGGFIIPYVNAFPITGGIGLVYTAGNNSPHAVMFDRVLV